jgi:hypothetical protein
MAMVFLLDRLNRPRPAEGPRRVWKPEIDIGGSCSFSSRVRRVVIPRGSRHKTAARGLDPAHRYFET